MLSIHLVTAIPALVRSPLEHSIIKRAVDSGRVQITVHDIRDFSHDRHRQIDDYPFGGGGGMVLKPEPLFECLESIQAHARVNEQSQVDEMVYLSPDGEQLTQALVNELSLKQRLVFVAGHYKGIDQRVRDTLISREISIGDYVLSGGELPALVLIDAIIRVIPGVIGDAESALSDSFQDGLLGAPVYTRPAEYRGLRVPEVLLSGDHERIEEWRDAERIRVTRERRPDLLN